ncbi:C-type lectin domain family 4 member E [Calliopsis andreniformis]|uniref:C-type lectin domain family 4 member E n=1 Tax=Calliopsis andreniformis TaxID=337506 RepID=UPI003FCEB001
MDRVTVFLIISIACSILQLIFCDRCCQINSRQLPYYKLIKFNARSNKVILSRKTVRNVNECREFALAKKALAFNYGWETDFRGKVKTHNKNGGTARRMCQALQCPEIYNSSTLVQDKNYAYYSIYSLYSFNDVNFTLTCVPKAGIFVFSSHSLNYSQAQITCLKMNATLAHIISEERTNGLAKYISQNTPTFVGLSNRDEENIWKNAFDEPLLCFKYRSWGKGQPSHIKGCVSLVQPNKLKAGPFWKVVPCDSILPFICEISTIYRFKYNANIWSL